ncbi:hypothetical protein EBB79_09255 [Parasedimentitalea marina]|uniref:Uncharacterized protein n=1 Tax=Parasedimentitalea marina TaxID=2483033 RepID=A0A3T0N232_9RHOB|nr:hypothetical protein [Parasedimentitalea marina]AZV78057.1 hypothetical protein EBB79_09255 [Parasedimentitalea marina]
MAADDTAVDIPEDGSREADSLAGGHCPEGDVLHPVGAIPEDGIQVGAHPEAVIQLDGTLPDVSQAVAHRQVGSRQRGAAQPLADRGLQLATGLVWSPVLQRVASMALSRGELPDVLRGARQQTVAFWTLMALISAQRKTHPGCHHRRPLRVHHHRRGRAHQRYPYGVTFA